MGVRLPTAEEIAQFQRAIEREQERNLKDKEPEIQKDPVPVEVPASEDVQTVEQVVAPVENVQVEQPKTAYMNKSKKRY